MRMPIVDNVHIDHCDRHCGTFFVPGELAATVHPILDEGFWNNDQTVVSRRLSKLRSPVDELWMESIVLDAKTKLTIDRCTKTGGFWLDDGECEKLYKFVLARGQDKNHTLGEQRETRGIWSYVFQVASQLPLEVWHPTRRMPVATYGVLALIIITYLMQLWARATPEAPTMLLYEYFALLPDFIERGSFWQPLTYALLHSNATHLFANACMLYLYGDNVEDIMGSKPFLAVLAVSTIAGGLLEYAMETSENNKAIVGISAGVAGIMGTYLYLFPKVKIRLAIFVFIVRVPAFVLVAIWIALQFFGLTKSDSNVAYWAHLGGLAAGLAFTLYYGGFKTITQRIKAQKPVGRWR